jgi:hypothetical protein
METAQPAPAGLAEPAEPLPTFKHFLETSPPDIEVIVTDRASGPYEKRGYSSGTFYNLLTPELDLHCDECDGIRTFKCINQYAKTLSRRTTFEELDYECKNCKEGEKFRKRFCLAVIGESKQGPVQKIGEYPAYNPVTSRKVYDLIGENHRELFLQGRRAELRGLGIGAFAYYRRIVDDQKNVIIDRLEKLPNAWGRQKTFSKRLPVPKHRTSLRVRSKRSRTRFHLRCSLLAIIR